MIFLELPLQVFWQTDGNNVMVSAAALAGVEQGRPAADHAAGRLGATGLLAVWDRCSGRRAT